MSIDHLRPWMSWIADQPVPRGERVGQIEIWRQGRREGGDSLLGPFVGEGIGGAAGMHRWIGPRGVEPATGSVPSRSAEDAPPRRSQRWLPRVWGGRISTVSRSITTRSKLAAGRLEAARLRTAFRPTR